MYRRLLRFALAGVFALAIAGTILGIARVTGLWLGRNSDNFWYLLKLTVPFALLLAMVALAWPEPRAERSGASSLIFVALGGAFFGCAYWCVITYLLAGLFLGLAVQSFACWSAAAAVSLLLVLGKRSYGVLAMAFFVSALGLVLPEPVFNLLSHNQTMTVAIVVPEDLATVSADPKEVGFESESEVGASASHVLQAIRAAGLGGHYRIVHLSRYGKGKEALAILVLNTRVTSRIRLAEPNASEVIYVQGPTGWIKTPPEAPTLQRSIEAWEARNHKDALADLDIPDADGVSSIVRVDGQKSQ